MDFGYEQFEKDKTEEELRRFARIMAEETQKVNATDTNTAEMQKEYMDSAPQ